MDASHRKAEINNPFRVGDMVLWPEILLLTMPNYQSQHTTHSRGTGQ